MKYTIGQLIENDATLIDSSWYNILQIIITQVQTVQTPDANGRN